MEKVLHTDKTSKEKKIQCTLLEKSISHSYFYYKIYLKSLLKIVIFLKKHGVVDDDLGRGNPQVNDLIIHSFTSLFAMKTESNQDKCVGPLGMHE